MSSNDLFAFATDPFHPGDADLDYDVDITDFNTLAQNFHTGFLWWQGNFDADVDITDFNMLSANFAPGGVSASDSLAAVPEPAAILLAISALVMLAHSGSRHGR